MKKIFILIIVLFIFLSCSRQHYNWFVVDRLCYEYDIQIKYAVVLRNESTNSIIIVEDDYELFLLTEKTNYISNLYGWKIIKQKEKR